MLQWFHMRCLARNLWLNKGRQDTLLIHLINVIIDFHKSCRWYVLTIFLILIYISNIMHFNQRCCYCSWLRIVMALFNKMVLDRARLAMHFRSTILCWYIRYASRGLLPFSDRYVRGSDRLWYEFQAGSIYMSRFYTHYEPACSRACTPIRATTMKRSADTSVTFIFRLSDVSWIFLGSNEHVWDICYSHFLFIIRIFLFRCEISSAMYIFNSWFIVVGVKRGALLFLMSHNT